MRLYFIIVLVLLSVFCSSCLVKNLTKKSIGETLSADKDFSHCSLHNVNMRRTIVKIHHGRYCIDKNNKELYPNAKKIVCRGCVVKPEKVAVIFYCRKCNKIKKKSVKSNIVEYE